MLSGPMSSHLRSHDAVHPNIGRHAQRAAEHRDENMSDRDLELPEASLRRLQRQESATRPPRAYLAPVSGFAPVHANSRRHSGESAGNGFQSPRSLEPERLPPPPEMSRRNILAPLGIVVASILVATIAYYLRWVGGSRRQSLRLDRKRRHSIRQSSRRRHGPQANKRPGPRWLKTMILRRRSRVRPPSVPRRHSQ